MWLLVDVSVKTIGLCVFEDSLSVAGGNWPSTLALWMVDGLTWKTCQPGSLSCDTHAQVEVSVQV